MRRLLWILLILGCAGLFTYSLLRMFRLSFTHDESLSYTIIIGDPEFRDSANHHPLNTRAMAWMSHWFGDREWSLRLPNLMALILYLTSGMLLLRKFGNPAVVLLGFALLFLNPFLFDFFGLARGYGIASALSLTSLWLLKEAWDRVGTWRGRGLLFLSFVFAALANHANFAWLNVHVAMMIAAIVYLIRDYRDSKEDARRALLFAAVFLTANTWSLINIVRRVLRMLERGQLYAGGKNGFIEDTAGTLVQTYLYDANYGEPARRLLLYIVVGAAILAGIVLVYRTVQTRRIGFPEIMLAVFFVACLEPIVGHILLGALFPVDRTALYFVPLFAILLTSVAGSLSSGPRILARTLSAVAGTVIFALMLLHFGKTANLTHVLIWSYDADTKTAMTDIEALGLFRRAEGRIEIGNTWVLAPAINYYRVTRGYDWMEPATRAGPTGKRYDVLLCYPEDLDGSTSEYMVIKRYERTGLELRVAQRP